MVDLQPGALTLEQLQAIHAGGERLAVPAGSRQRIRASASVVQRAAAGDAPVYGVNTGFGKLAGTRIGANDLAQLQLNLIRSHSVGVNAPPDSTVSIDGTWTGACPATMKPGDLMLPDGRIVSLAKP